MRFGRKAPEKPQGSFFSTCLGSPTSHWAEGFYEAAIAGTKSDDPARVVFSAVVIPQLVEVDLCNMGKSGRVAMGLTQQLPAAEGGANGQTELAIMVRGSSAAPDLREAASLAMDHLETLIDPDWES